MASELRVNTINSRSGLGTITVSDTGAVFTGITTIGSVTVDGGTVTGNLTGTASTATASATAYGLSGSPTLTGITSVSTTNLTVNGNAYPAAGPLSNRNLIINGAMRVAQRGTSATNSGYGAVDRFRPSFNNVGVTQSQETLSSGDPYNEGFRYFNRYSNTSVSSGASTYIEIFTKIEAQDVAGSGWDYNNTSSYITISFWVRSSLAGTYYSVLRSDDGSVKFYTTAFTLSANTWSKVTYSAPGHSDLAFDNDTGEGLRVHVIPYYGTDFTDNSVSTDTWFTLSGSNYMPDYLQNWANTASATFDITGVQLEVGSVATPFEHRSYGDELARCQRYYYRHAEGLTGSVGVGAYYQSSRIFTAIHFPVQMRVSPTLDASDFSAAYTALRNSASESFAGFTGIQAVGNHSVIIESDNTLSGTAGQAGWVQTNNTSTQISFNSEL